MADYASIGRTNSFVVKDVEQFKTSLAEHGIDVAEDRPSYEGDVEIVTNADGSITLLAPQGWPRMDEDSVLSRLGLDCDGDVKPATVVHEALEDLVAAHLVPGQVAIFTSVGFEKLRYLGGSAVAINAEGQTRSIDIDTIVDLAAELTDPSTKVTTPYL